MRRLRQDFAGARQRLQRLAVAFLIAVVASYLLGGLLILRTGEGQGALRTAKRGRAPIAVAAARGQPPEAGSYFFSKGALIVRSTSSPMRGT
jgi:hypothetical protein